MERSLDPPPHATHSPPRLRDVALAMLRLHWPAVRDVGYAPYALLQTLLPLSSASQLADLEHNSPHLVPHTNPIWRQLCVNEFIEIRKAVEDGHISDQDEPESWREQYDLEAIKREEKMQAIVSKMRGQINEYKHGRATTKEVDWRLEKRRKVASSSTASTRPKTLMEKARHNTKQIKSIYAPRRGVRPVPPPPRPSVSAAGGAPTSFAPAPPPVPSAAATALTSGSLFATCSPSRNTKGGPALSTSAAAAAAAAVANHDQQQLKKRTRETATTTTSTSDSATTTTTLFTNTHKKPKLSNASSSAVKITTTTTTTTLARKSSPAKRPLVVSSEPPAKHQPHSGSAPRLETGRKSESTHNAAPALPSSSSKRLKGGSPRPPPPPSARPSPAKQPPSSSSCSRPPFSPPPALPRPPPARPTFLPRPGSAPGPGLAPMLPPSTSTSNRPVVVPRGIFMPKKRS